MSKKVLVDEQALHQVLFAVNQPLEHGHLIRELQATRNLPGHTNPINTLVREFEEAKSAPQATTTITYTKSEVEAMQIYMQIKGGAMTTNDDPEEGIRFFTSLVDRIREERSVLAIRNR